jgi:hypothetical protein
MHQNRKAQSVCWNRSRLSVASDNERGNTSVCTRSGSAHSANMQATETAKKNP